TQVKRPANSTKRRVTPSVAAASFPLTGSLGLTGLGGVGRAGFSFASTGFAAGDSAFGVGAAASVAGAAPAWAFFAAAAARIASSLLIGFDAAGASAVGSALGCDA